MRNKLSAAVMRKRLLKYELENYELEKDCRLLRTLKGCESIEVPELVKLAKVAHRLSKSSETASLAKTLVSQLNAKVESINKSMERIIKLKEAP